MNVGDTLVLIPKVLRFTYVQNEGAAFGMLSEHRWVFMVISTVAIVAIFIYLWKFRPESKLACVALSLIVSGGIGNMIDRILRSGVDAKGNVYYYVVDFIDFYAFPNVWKWVFNVADAFVCIGCGLMFLWCLRSIIEESRAEKLKKLENKNPESEE
jgi:signal peptidase II